MERDHVDDILGEWAVERPDLDVAAQGVIGRISRLSRILEWRLDEVFRRFGLNGGEFDVLATLRRAGGAAGLTASDLAARCMLSSAAMTNRLDRLQQAGLVTRAGDRNDRRVVRVALTAGGRTLIDEAFAAHIENEQRLLASLPPRDRRLLVDLLRRLLVVYEDASQPIAGADNGVAVRRPHPPQRVPAPAPARARRGRR